MESNSQNRNRNNLALIEAALYVAGKPLSIKTLGSIIGTRSTNNVRGFIKTLSQEYSNNNSALELVEITDGFVLQLKPKYVPRVRRLSIRPTLSKGPLKTLSFIAYHEPVVQSRVINARGSHAYKHIRELVEWGLIEREKLGKTKIIRTTKAFLGYFDLSRNARLRKRQLNTIFKSVSTKREAR